MTFWTAVEPAPKYRSIASTIVVSVATAKAHVHPQRAAEIVHHGGVGRVRAGHHQDAVLDGEGTEAVLAHVLGREALEERRARGELVAPDVGDLEVAGQRLAHLLRARQT
jgi:hypothetical protein